MTYFKSSVALVELLLPSQYFMGDNEDILTTKLQLHLKKPVFMLIKTGLTIKNIITVSLRSITMKGV